MAATGTMTIKRMFSPSLGMGDLDWGYERNTFTPDDKARGAVSYDWRHAATGRPNVKEPKGKANKAAHDEWDAWVYFTTRDGEVHVYRRDGAPPVAESKQTRIPGA